MDRLMLPYAESSGPSIIAMGKQAALPGLESLAIAPPAPPPAAIEASDDSSNSESGSNIGDACASGSFTFSSLSSNGQLTPPFSSSSNSSTLDIADHDIDITSTAAAAASADTREERAADSRRRSRARQSTTTGKADRVSRSEVRRYAAEIVRKEAKALLDLAARLDPEEPDTLDHHHDLPRLKPENVQDAYSKAMEILKSMDSHGRIIMTGVGKSGLLARKAVATFNSFGIPSAFLHPVEALHGDLGLISPYGVDTVILISYSGRTTELLDLLQHLRQRRVYACISLSSPDSALAEACDVNIDVSLENDEEAEDCVPAPTSSVVTALAALDALALTLLRLKTGWYSHISERRKAFGLHHPGGSLGQQLSSAIEQS